ncbi:hypothetical protein A1O7_08640 [Cladophialophora yegresii CBS 114405]|uniref:Uncharacterized protein n=1 Tax=Cladophialophora yegresii CBS 114405 TaxID=1182544 RepID=W9VU61_9EURO|nr:uncharacterized protein A1O7_08640 [Cladophialophora yegresii CBS 114405]EXJ55711.1 hypothetical protein A1O7_08640 [Cladophialophora yegresii CBS 114405]
MGLKLYINVPHASARTIVVEIPSHQSTGKDDVVNICLQEGSEFQCQVMIPGREHTDQNVHVLAQQNVDIGSEVQNARNIMGQTCTLGGSYVEPSDTQRHDRGAWHPQGCGSDCGHGCNVGVGTNNESLLLRAYLAGCSTDDATDKGIAAGQPVAVIPDPQLNGMVSRTQATPVNRCSPHPVAARCEHLSCAAAYPCCPPCPGRGAQLQASSHPGGGRACEPYPFVGAVGSTIGLQASEAEQHATLEQRIKNFRGISLLMRKLNGDPIKPTATMDTGADRNVMIKGLVDLLRFPINKHSDSTTTRLSVLNDMEADTLGTVELDFSLFCSGTPLRKVVFHVVEKLGRHQILLGVELIMELGLLYRLPCICHA